MVLVKIFMINENFNQPTKNSNSKTKIFVRYTGGASGHFVGCLCWMLLTKEPIVLLRPNTAANEMPRFEQYQNLITFRDFGEKNKRLAEIMNSENGDIESKIQWVHDNIEWHNSPHNFYLTCVHAPYPDPLLYAFKNTKLLNISINKNNIDQLAFNLATKALPVNDVKIFGNFYKRALGVLKIYKEIDQSLVSIQDLKFQSWVYKMTVPFDKFIPEIACPGIPTFNIAFNDLTNGILIQRLPELADFLEVELTIKIHVEAIKFIKLYSASQVPVPWNFDEFPSKNK